MSKHTSTTPVVAENCFQSGRGGRKAMRYTRMIASAGLMAIMASSAFVPSAFAQSSEPSASPVPSAIAAPVEVFIRADLAYRPLNPRPEDGVAVVGDQILIDVTLTNTSTTDASRVTAGARFEGTLDILDVQAPGAASTRIDGSEVGVQFDQLGAGQSVTFTITTLATTVSGVQGGPVNAVNVFTFDSTNAHAVDDNKTLQIPVFTAESPNPSPLPTPSPSAPTASATPAPKASTAPAASVRASAAPAQLPDTGAEDVSGWLAAFAAGGLFAGGLAARRSLRRETK